MGAVPGPPGSPSRVAGALALLALTSAGCGGSSPTAPDAPTLYSVTLQVFLDEDGDGVPGPRELQRMPGVEVRVGGRSGVTDAQGRALVTGVPGGSQPVSVLPSSLPQFFEPAGVPPIGVPAPAEVLLPVVLPAPGRRLHVFMASGDSISEGFGSSSFEGYRRPLRVLLEDYWGAPVEVPYAGPGGGNSSEALGRIDADLAELEPAWALLQWGVNDWLVAGCQPDPRDCGVVQNIATLVARVQASGSLPVLATLTPVNVGANDQAPASREEWVQLLNEEIRSLAASSGALLVDVHAAFDAAGPTSELFVDHVHPNDAGYALIADAYFRALTGPRP